MLLWTLVSVAFAAPCPDVSAQVDLAWSAYDEAELENAKALLASAYGSLGCQRTVLAPEDLLALYRLDALVSLTLEDRKGAVYATIRAVGVDHENADPPAEYGPELAELYDTWSSRLGETLVTVSVGDGGTVWVDGRRVDRAASLQVVEGEHLVQTEGIVGLTSEVRDLTGDAVLSTGVPLPAGEEVVDPVLPEEPVERPDRGRRHPAALLVGGGVSAALGAAALGSAWRSERVFLANDYTARRYDDCTRDQRCYDAARQAAIETDADRIRIAYAAGYGLGGLGAVLLGVGIVGFPVHTDGRTVSLDFRW